jgi:hypothetical protein
MSLMTLKAGVLVSQQVVIALAVVNAATTLGLPDMVITSGRDGTHLPNSLHYRDRALDFRTRQLTPDQQQALVTATRTRLGAGYDLILESDHLHIEYDPKPEGTH